MEGLHKLWKHHAVYLKALGQKNENPPKQCCNNSIKVKIGLPVVVNNQDTSYF